MPLRRLIPLALVLLMACLVCPTASRAQGRPSVSSQERALIAQRNMLRANLVSALATYSPNYPEVLAIRQRIKTVDKQLAHLYQQPPASSQDVIRRSRVWLLAEPSQKKA